jgi:hypothetical protein
MLCVIFKVHFDKQISTNHTYVTVCRWDLILIQQILLTNVSKSTVFSGKGIRVDNFKVDKCFGVGFLGQQTVKTRRLTKIVLVI